MRIEFVAIALSFAVFTPGTNAQVTVAFESGQVCSSARCPLTGCSPSSCENVAPLGNVVSDQCFFFPDWVFSDAFAEIGSGALLGMTSRAEVESDGCPGTSSATTVTTLSANGPTAAELAIRVSVTRAVPSIVTSISRGLAEVDMDNDGSADYATPNGTLDFTVPVVLTSRIMRIGTHAEALASGPAQVRSNFIPDRSVVDANIRVQPAGNALATELAPCAGLELGARLDPSPVNELTFWATDTSVSPTAFFTFGIAPRILPIPPTNCPLASKIVAVVPAVVSNGEAVLEVPLPEPAPPGTFYMQYLNITAAGVGSSNRIRVTL